VHLGLEFRNFPLQAGDFLRVVGLVARAGQELAQFLHPGLGGVELLLLLFVHGGPRNVGVAMPEKGG